MIIPEKRIFVRSVDLRDASGREDEIEGVRTTLLRLKLNPLSLNYRGFDGHRLPMVLEYGDDVPGREYIYCTPAEEFYAEGHNFEPQWHPLTYMGEERPAISVYDATKMFPRGAMYDYGFESGITPLDALVGVLKLKYLQTDRSW